MADDAGDSSVDLLSKLNEDIEALLSALTKENKKEMKPTKTHTEALLDRLYQFLSESDGIETVLERIPETGHFLGKLVATNVVRGDPQIYQKVIKCVLCLYREHPTSSLERKANEWSMTQIRSTVSGEQMVRYPTCSVGLDHTTITMEYVKQTVISIVKEMKKLHTNSLCDIGKIKDAILDPLTTLLSSCHTNNICISLWEAVLDILAYYPLNDDDVSRIYKQLTENVMKELQDVTDNHGILAKLCHQYRPALEQQVLTTLEACKNLVLPSSFKSKMMSSPLPGLCAESQHIMLMTFQMLYTVLRESGGSYKVALVIHSLHECIQNQKAQISSQKRESPGSHFIYPHLLHSLVSCLAVPSSDLDVEESALHIHKICLHIDFLRRGDNFSKTDLLCLHMCLLHHKGWYDRALQICLVCKKAFVTVGCFHLISSNSSRAHVAEHVPACLDLLVQYHSLDGEGFCTQVTGSLLECVMSLRSLQMKRSLGVPDLLCALSAEEVEKTHPAKDTIIRQILLAFLFSSTGGLNLILHILQMATKSENKEEHLIVLMEAHEYLNIDFRKWSTSAVQEYRYFIESLMTSACSSSDFKDHCFYVHSAVQQFLKESYDIIKNSKS